jgi:hypothetical protein
MTNIYEEINKCQLLCISCHTVVTKVELQCGFTRVKRHLTKEYNETNDISKKDSLTKEYSKIYNKFMNEAYLIIKQSI